MVGSFSHLEEILDDGGQDTQLAKIFLQLLVHKVILEVWLDASVMEPVDEDRYVQIEDEHKRKFTIDVETMMSEYFLLDNTLEPIQIFEELVVHEYNSRFFKKLITLAEERKEMASILQSTHHKEDFSIEGVVNGFIILLEIEKDKALDRWDTPNKLALLLTRAVSKDVLTPLNLEEVNSRLLPNCCRSETVWLARSLEAVS